MDRKYPELIVEIEITEGKNRVDQLLLAKLKVEFPDLSRSTLKKLFKDKHISLGNRLLSASTELRPGHYKIKISPWEEAIVKKPLAVPSEKGCFLNIIYEDDELLILDKKSGVPSIPHSSSETETAVNAALAHSPSLKNVGRQGLEPSIVHRLDTGTSGVLVFAKNNETFETLKVLWKTDQIRKEYRAIVRTHKTQATHPAPPAKRSINYPIAHDAESAKKMVAVTEEVKSGAKKNRKTRGKHQEAVTEILKTKKLRDDMYDVHVEIKTGVMHQIRCHLSALGWPVLGDNVYKGIPASRLWLHAWRITLPLSSGKSLTVQSELPQNWPT